MAKQGKIGVSELEFGKLDEDDLVIDPTQKLPGTTEIGIELGIDISTLPADDGPYLTVSSGITTAKQTINNYDLTSEIKQLLFGIEVIGGVEVYEKGLVPNDTATLFRTRLTGGKYVWIAMLKGKFTLPNVTAKTTGDGNPEPTPDQIEGSFVARKAGDKEVVLLIGREDNKDFDFDTFHTMVFPKTAEETEIKAKTAV